MTTSRSSSYQYVHTDRRDERCGERIVREPEQNARLAHARVADQQQFE